MQPLALWSDANVVALVVKPDDAAMMATDSRMSYACRRGDHGRVLAELPALRQAPTGCFLGDHAFFVGQTLAHEDALDEANAAVGLEIEGRRAPFAATMARLQTIRGMAQRTAEVRVNTRRFPTAAHRVSCTGLCPRNNGSAGKRKRGTTRKGCRRLRIVLIDTALAASRTKSVPSRLATGG